AHAGGAMLDALLQRALGARTHVLDRHAFLEGLYAGDRAIPAALLRRAALDDARFVEVDVAFDQPGAGEVPLSIVDVALRGEPGLNGCNTPMFHADIDRRIACPIGKTRVADNQIHASAIKPE